MIFEKPYSVYGWAGYVMLSLSILLAYLANNTGIVAPLLSFVSGLQLFIVDNSR